MQILQYDIYNQNKNVILLQTCCIIVIGACWNISYRLKLESINIQQMCSTFFPPFFSLSQTIYSVLFTHIRSDILQVHGIYIVT